MKFIISATNLVNGGPFTIIKQCLDSIENSIEKHNLVNINFIALVNSKELFPKYKHIHLISLPEPKRSWLKRMWYEYVVMNKISKKLEADIWVSLHDMSPRVSAKVQAVYMHNPILFGPTKKSDIIYIPTYYLWVKLYKYIYKLNIHSNSNLIVQQQWLRNEFSQMFNFGKENIIVFPPERETQKKTLIENSIYKNTFIYAAYPRIFKNFEIICEAAKILVNRGIYNFKIRLTLDGSENHYTKQIREKYSNIQQIEFCGILPSEQMTEFYENSSCLIFPSKLETFGLPITEYSSFGNPMLIADLPYAHETASGFDNVAFFNPENANELADLMIEHINCDNKSLATADKIKYQDPYMTSWESLINYLIQKYENKK